MDTSLEAKSPDQITFETQLRRLNSTPIGRRAFLALAPLLLAACATGEKRPRAQLTVGDEVMIARRALPEVRKDYPALQDADIQKYVSSLGSTLAARAQLEKNPYAYTFTVVDVPMVNAFALPSGPIFVTAPLLKMVESEAELAGVLGHEIGHVKARHAAKKVLQLESAKNESWLYGTGGAVAGAAAASVVSAALCRGLSSCTSTLIIAGAAAGVKGGLLVQKYIFLANTRENELEADRIGFDVALASGHQASHIGDFYSRLLSNKSGSTAIQDALQTHPPSEERVAQLNLLVRQSHQKPNSVLTSTDFDSIKKRIQSL